jgi:hypothetical protein
VSTPSTVERQPLARFDGGAAWEAIGAERQAEIGAAALELVASMHVLERVHEDRLDGRLARAGEAAQTLLFDLLRSAFADAVPREALDGSDGSPRIPSLLGPVCRQCGCSELDACAPGCSWSKDPHLCTACAGAEP